MAFQIVRNRMKTCVDDFRYHFKLTFGLYPFDAYRKMEHAAIKLTDGVSMETSFYERCDYVFSKRSGGTNIESAFDNIGFKLYIPYESETLPELIQNGSARLMGFKVGSYSILNKLEYRADFVKIKDQTETDIKTICENENILDIDRWKLVECLANGNEKWENPYREGPARNSYDYKLFIAGFNNEKQEIYAFGPVLDAGWWLNLTFFQ